MQALTEITKLLGKLEHPKMSKLREVVKSEIKNNPNARFIIFGQYRDSVVEINKIVNKIPGINARIFVGQMKKGDTGLSQQEQQIVLNQFRMREINVLNATSIGEEGLDLPEVSVVIFYEPVPSAIRSIQRRGRTARLSKGKLVVLLTKGTKDEISYWTSARKEKTMYRVLGEIKRKLDSGIKDKQKTLL